MTPFAHGQPAGMPPAALRTAAPFPLAARLISLRPIAPVAGATFEWHSHPFDEFTLVTEDACQLGYSAAWHKTIPNTLLHYRAGVRHGALTTAGQRPRFWVVHYSTGPGVGASAGHPASSPGPRAWHLTPEQSHTFQWIFFHLLSEHSAERESSDEAEAAWLQLLLVFVERLSGSLTPSSALPNPANPEVLKLWELVNAVAGDRPPDRLRLYSAPNYDSVRHAFRRAFGCSPREMLHRLRVEHAKNLLLESPLSIKEIAARVGYAAPHDFNRMFHRQTGCAPSRWRADPLARVGGK